MRIYLVIAVALTILGCSADKIARLEKQNRELSAKLDAVGKAASLDLQEKCAKQASAVFKELGWSKEPLASYANHYSQKLNKCFIEITSTKLPSMSISVSDAFEGKEYGDYFWINTQGKKYWEVRPSICKVTLLSGEDKICSSQDEFADLVKSYMEQ